MPRGRPEDYNVRGKPSSGVKASAKGRATAASKSGGRSSGKPAAKRTLPSQASATARKNAFGKQGARKRKS